MDTKTIAQPAAAPLPNLSRLPERIPAPGRVRLVKDVLWPGRYYIGEGASGAAYWDVTRQTLNDVEAAFNEQMAQGMVPPLCFTHGDDPARDIANIAHLWVDNGGLWMATYVTEDDAAELMKLFRQVSIMARFQFTDGTGKVWPIFVQHVAVVQHGRVPNQQPFVQMGIGKAKPLTAQQRAEVDRWKAEVDQRRRKH
jgi:hypothetical protein